MVSIIQRRRNRLAFPFKTDRMGQQLDCQISRQPQLSATITAEPLLACTVSASRRDAQEEGLDYDSITAGQLLSAAFLSLAEIQCVVSCVPAMDMTIKRESLLTCAVSAQPLLMASITRESQLDARIKALPLLNLKLSTSPAISARISNQ